MPIPALELEPAATTRPHTDLPTGPILVASDGAEESDAAVHLAWALAGHTAADVQVASVLEPLPTATEIAALANLRAFQSEQREAQLSAVRAQIARRVSGECAWPIELIDGVAASTLGSYVSSRHARLLVMGRGRHALPARWLGGETVLRALRFGETPVLAISPGANGLPRRVVMAIDFSAYSLYAARVALSLVAPDALIYLVHVRPHARFTGPVSARWEHQYAEVVPALLEDVRARLNAPPDMQVETIVLSGDPAPALIEFAESASADLVVSGSHGYGFLNRLVLGSVATELLHGASASLLCVPGSALAHAAAREEQSSRLRANALGRGDWMHTLIEFSHRFAGERCVVEWRPATGSARTIEFGHPFVGASYDDRDDAVTLMTGTGRLEGPHASHFVSGVRGIDELRTENGELRGLRVGGRHGATTLRVLP